MGSGRRPSNTPVVNRKADLLERGAISLGCPSQGSFLLEGFSEGVPLPIEGTLLVDRGAILLSTPGFGELELVGIEGHPLPRCLKAGLAYAGRIDQVDGQTELTFWEV